MLALIYGLGLIYPDINPVHLLEYRLQSRVTFFKLAIFQRETPRPYLSAQRLENEVQSNGQIRY